MARHWFGGGAADSVASNGRPRVGVTVTLWTARVGGSQVTDLLDEDGVPITAVVSGAEGLIPPFQGPDEVTELYALAGGARVQIDAHDLDDLAEEASDDAAAAAASAAAAAASAASAATSAAGAVARANHTGTQAISTVSGLQTALDAKLASADASGTYGRKVNGIVASAVATDGTDQTSVLQAEITALLAAGGGTLLLPEGTITINGTLTLGHDGASPPKQAPLRLVGTGEHWSGRGTAVQGGTVLDIRGTHTYGKVYTLGLGLLAAQHITFTDSAGTTTPFIYTTNTTLQIDQCAFVGTKYREACDQDAIICGGTVAAEGGAADPTHGFQGYGTVISRNFFSGIRRGVYGRVYFNSAVIRDNTWWSTCGGGSDAAAIHLDGSVGFCWGNVIDGNLIEMTGYAYGVRLTRSQRNMVTNTAFWDADAGLVACVFLDARSGQAADCYGNYIVAMIPDADPAKWVIDGAGGTTAYTMYVNGYIISGAGAAPAVRPMNALGSESTTLQSWVRSNQQGTNPGQTVMNLIQNGQLYVGGTWSSSAGVIVRNGSSSVAVDHNSVVQSGTGDLLVYPGTAATARVRFMRGVVQLPQYTTAGRPAASAGIGCCYYDTTVNKPVWSDGSTWRDATGTAV